MASADRGPRRRLSPQQRREALIDAAIEVVATSGYERASFAAIAHAAGASKGLIWHHFTDGNDLMVQAARTALVLLREAVAADLDLTMPVPTVIRSAIARAAQLPTTHPREITALSEIITKLRGPDGAPLLSTEEYEQTYTLQMTLFARGQQEGTLRALDPHLLAVTYQGALDTMLNHLRTHPEVDGAEYARELADLLLNGIAMPPGTRTDD